MALMNLIQNGVNGMIFTNIPDDSPVLELRADPVSSLWCIGPATAIDTRTSEYYTGCMLFITIIPNEEGRIVFRVWIIDDQGESVSYSEE